MALSDEQKAMLRLLAQGEQGYGDIAALMGLQESEVRAKVVGALAQLEAEGEPAPDIPPPTPGGARPAAEVDPPEPEPVAEASGGSADDDEPAVAEAVAPREPVTATGPGTAKGASAARPSKARPKGASAAAETSRPRSAGGATSGGPKPSRSSSGGRTITLPTGRGAWVLGGGIAAGIAVIVVVVLLVFGGGGGDDSSSNPLEAAPTNSNAGAATGETGGTKEATQADLAAVDGSEAKGIATFGRVNDKLALQIEATGLEPTTEGTNSYAIWLAQSPKRMLPLATVGVKGSGKAANTIAAQFEVPVEVLAYLAGGTFDQISITKVENERFEASVDAATKAKSTPKYTGDAVLRGTISGPIIGVAQREEEAAGGE